MVTDTRKEDSTHQLKKIEDTTSVKIHFKKNLLELNLAKAH